MSDWKPGARQADEETVAEAMAWVDTRRADPSRRPVEEVLAEQARYAAKPWYQTVAFAYDTPANLRFIRGILDFDPTAVLPQVRCPVLALFGGADNVIPVHASLRAFAEHLPPHPQHGFAVFPVRTTASSPPTPIRRCLVVINSPLPTSHRHRFPGRPAATGGVGSVPPTAPRDGCHP